MEESGLIEMLGSLLPVGKESAAQLGPAFYEQLQVLLAHSLEDCECA